MASLLSSFVRDFVVQDQIDHSLIEIDQQNNDEADSTTTANHTAKIQLCMNREIIVL